MEERMETVEISLGEGDDEAKIQYCMEPDRFAAEDGPDADVYTIRLEMTRGGVTTRAVVRGLTPSAEKCRSVIQLLARGAVTPVTFRDVLEDLAANDFEPLGARFAPALCRAG